VHSKQLDDLTQKVADLANKHLSLQSSVQSASSQFADHASSIEVDVPIQLIVRVPNSALDIVDEMNDRERRNFNVLVYNFLKGADRKTDIKAFQTLSTDEILVWSQQFVWALRSPTTQALAFDC